MDREDRRNFEAVIGLDTSNYTTSVALVGKTGTFSDQRKILNVKKGEKGLRQSEALFQHVQNLPHLIQEVMKSFSGKIIAVSAASRPRPVEGSYMPVFTAGHSMGKSLAAILRVPYYEFSHQEGHIEALRPEEWKEFQCFHISGGTGELLKVDRKGNRIIGGSKDISPGQLLDRIGVAMGYSFPAGQDMDRLAMGKEPSEKLTPVSVTNQWMNLSGMESQCLRLLNEGREEKASLISAIFHHLAEAIIQVTGKQRTLMVGGVSSSRTLKFLLKKHSHLKFPDSSRNPGLGLDNAVGIARLGGNKVWL